MVGYGIPMQTRRLLVNSQEWTDALPENPGRRYLRIAPSVVVSNMAQAESAMTQGIIKVCFGSHSDINFVSAWLFKPLDMDTPPTNSIHLRLPQKIVPDPANPGQFIGQDIEGWVEIIEG